MQHDRRLHVQTPLIEGRSMLLVSEGTSTPPTFTIAMVPRFGAFLTLVEHNSCQSSARSDCVKLNCRCPALRNMDQSPGCGILSGRGHSLLNGQKYYDEHLPGMVLYLVCRFSVSHW